MRPLSFQVRIRQTGTSRRNEKDGSLYLVDKAATLGTLQPIRVIDDVSYILLLADLQESKRRREKERAIFL